MLFLNSVRVAPGVRSALAVACGLALSGWVMAQDVDEVEPVVITASRMPQLLQTAPIGASVITSEQIRRSGVADANEAIRKLGGVVGKSDLSGGREQSLDIRGYGDAATSNTVVLIDGMRISENELSSARLSAIPLDQIDRIEIVRGGSSVLWGDGATAGVINVILKRGPLAKGYAKLSTSIETYGGHDVSFSGAQQVGALRVDGAVNRVRSEGAREHSVYKQDGGSLGVQFGNDTWQQRFRVLHESQQAQYPGYLTFAQYEANPRYSAPSNALSEGRQEETRFISNTEYRQGALKAQLDFASRRRNVDSSYSQRVVDSHQLTPKVSYVSHFESVELQSIVGADFQRWLRETPVQFYGGDISHDAHTAVFMNHSLNLPSRTRVDVGLRRERAIRQDETPYSSFDQRSNLDAQELGVSQQLDKAITVYGRLARAYRLGNLDENGYTPDGSPLRPQRSRDKELGIRWVTDAQLLNLRVFRQDNVDEIMYAPSPIDGISYNLNADPTRRQGVEMEGRWSVTKALEVRATWQQLTARYRAGVFAGQDLVLVAPRSGTARMSYKIDDKQSIDLGVQHRAEMRFGDDYSNSCARRIPASTLFDARYAWTDKDWVWAMAVTNLSNQIGYSYAYRCQMGALYPDAGRAFKATVSRQF